MTARDRRALRIGGGVVLGGLLLFRGLPAVWRAWHDAREALAARSALLLRAEAALDGFEVVEQRGAEINARFVALAPRLVAGNTEAEAQADLNGRVALIANRERTRLLRADPVGDSLREGVLHRVQLRIEVESDWSGLVGFLRGLVADPAVLRVTAVTLRGSETPATSGGPEVLTAQVEIAGWYLERRPTAGEGD